MVSGCFGYQSVLVWTGLGNSCWTIGNPITKATNAHITMNYLACGPTFGPLTASTGSAKMSPPSQLARKAAIKTGSKWSNEKHRGNSGLLKVMGPAIAVQYDIPRFFLMFFSFMISSSIRKAGHQLQLMRRFCSHYAPPKLKLRPGDKVKKPPGSTEPPGSQSIYIYLYDIMYI